MSLLASLAVLIVAALHVFFLVLEMFLWTTARGRKRTAQPNADAPAAAKPARKRTARSSARKPARKRKAPRADSATSETTD